MNVTTNYNEFLSIEDYLKSIDIPISTLDILPRTIESGHTRLDEPVSISPESAGPLAPMFKSINVSIYWKTEEHLNKRVTILSLDYRYTHPSGSNGYTVHLYSVDGSDFQDDYDVMSDLLRK